MTPEQRIEGITSRYQLSAQQEYSLRQIVTYLKTTIDNKCQCDTYQFLQIIKIELYTTQTVYLNVDKILIF